MLWRLGEIVGLLVLSEGQTAKQLGSDGSLYIA